jgi:hypothetical protein
MSALFRKGGLRVKLIIWVFLPTVLVLFAVVIYAYFAFQRLTQDLLIERHTENNYFYTQQIADSIEYYNNLLTGEARILADYQGDLVAQQTVLKNDSSRLFIF